MIWSKKLPTQKTVTVRKLLFFLSLIVLFISCNRALYDYTLYSKGAILKGELNDGNTIYLIRENDSQHISGNSFVYNGQAIVNMIPFNLSNSGTITFDVKNTFYEGKIKTNKKGMGMSLSMPAIPELALPRQTVNLSYWDVITPNTGCYHSQHTQLYDSIVVHSDIQYGIAPGYYTSQSIDSVPLGDTETYRRLILKDVRAASGKRDSLPLLMDVYQPYDPTHTPKPVFVFIHGGGFFLGDKNNKLQATITNDLVKNGYVVVAIDYRLGSTIFGVKSVEKLIYSGIQDARAALRYIVHNSSELEIDPNQIYIGGSSAGAIIALNTAFMDNDEVFRSAERRRIRNELGNINTSGNDLTDNYSIAGVVSMWGAVLDLSIIDGRNADIPLLLFHGTADNIVPIDSGLPYQEEVERRIYNRLSERWQLYGSQAIYKHARSLNMPVQFFSFEDYGHEPQRNKDGSYNENIETIIQETNNFMYQKTHDLHKTYSISGDTEIHSGDKIAFYEIKDIDNAKVQWNIDGGLYIDRTGNTASVVWYDTEKEGKISACIIDETGDMQKVELLVRIYVE